MQQTIAQRQADENQRLMGRNMPYVPYTRGNNLEVYGTQTKYTRFQQPATVPEATPLSVLGFNVSAETDLLGSFRTLSCDPRTKYIPCASSDLYLAPYGKQGHSVMFDPSVPNGRPQKCIQALVNSSTLTFNNNTRTQVKDTFESRVVELIP